MFKWYKNAKICYAYLHDVKGNEKPRKSQSSFWKSRWFCRGWTLQELIAPATLHFYDTSWNQLGSKRSLASALERITKIPRGFLLGTFPLKDASVAQRMSWAANRVTKRKEDMAYCLLGIFEIHMPMAYGEDSNAFIRLQEEIIKQINDDSILAWNFVRNNSTTEFSNIIRRGALASNPSEFSESGHIVVPSIPSSSMRPLNTLGGSLQAERRIYTDSSGQCFVILQCHTNDSLDQVVGIPVAAQPEGYDNYIRLLGCSYVLLQPSISQANPQDIRIPIRHSNAQEEESLRFGFFIDNGLGEDLQISEAIPQQNLVGTDILITNDNTRSGRLHRLWVMFRHEQNESNNFVLVLERDCHERKPQALYHVMVCDKAITLEEIKNNFAKVSTSDRNKHSACNGTIGLEVTVSLERPGKQPMFVVRLLPGGERADTYNITNMLLQHQQETQIMNAFHTYHQAVDKAKDLQKSVKRKELKLDRMLKQLAEIEEQMIILANERFKLRKVEKDATSDLAKLRSESSELERSSAAYLDRAKTLQQRFDIQHGPMTVAKNKFEDWTDEATKEMLGKWDPKFHEAYLSISNLSHRFLLLAAAIGHEPPFRELAGGSISIDIATRDGRSLINLAACGGHGRIVQTLLILGADIEATDNNGCSPLISSCRYGHIDVARLLLDHGANIEASDNDGWSPLIFSCCYGHTDVARLLLDNGANIEATNNNGWSPLVYTCRNGYTDIVGLLLDKGAVMDYYPQTQWHLGRQVALIHATRCGHKETVQLLLHRGANKYLTDEGGSTAKYWATHKGHHQISDVLDAWGTKGAES
ncbi:putative beta transducin-like protein [Rosellinia necatrix]|uniref:Putative beta transducin-like protein n=1 Tax=Rosellinia necatrix TaxID=77044 RepID=A0A1W2TXG9_ROSNE|nr:putative beta transducin-like protein [Rosellinia necatrix]